MQANLQLISKHSELFETISELIISYSKGHLTDLFTIHFKEYYADELNFWETLTSFLPSIFSNESFQEELLPYIDDKIQEVNREFDTYTSDLMRSST